MKEQGWALVAVLLIADVLWGVAAYVLESRRAVRGHGPSPFPPILTTMYWVPCFIPTRSLIFNLEYAWSGLGVLRVVESLFTTVALMVVSMTIAMIGPQWLARKAAGGDPGTFWDGFKLWKSTGPKAAYPGALRPTDFFDRAQDTLGFVAAEEESDEDRQFILIWISARPQSLTMPMTVNGREIHSCKLVRGANFATGELDGRWVVVVSVFEELKPPTRVELVRNGEALQFSALPSHDADIWSTDLFGARGEPSPPLEDVALATRMEVEEHRGDIPIPEWCTHVLIERKGEGYVAVFGAVSLGEDSD